MCGGSTYYTTVQRDSHGLYVIYKAKDIEMKARAPKIKKKVQTVLTEGTKIRVTFGGMFEDDVIRVRCNLLTEENTQPREWKDGSPYELWRIVKDLYEEKYLKDKEAALAKVRKVLTKREMMILCLEGERC